MLHADDLDQQVQADATPDSCMPLARELLARASAAVPSLAQAEPEAARIGVRPIPADGLSAVGSVDGLAGYYVVVTHSGVTLAALLGQLAAQEIIAGESIALLAPFRPARLLRGTYANR
jgi:glycine/D-amino acid oxidase-like deaminating enzyme